MNGTKLIENGEFTEYFQYTPAIRKLIYTTNTVEGYHRQVRKVTKNKGVFPSDTALEKLVYFAYRDIREKWTMPLSQLLELRHKVAYFLFQIFLFPS